MQLLIAMQSKSFV